jgi:ankyrin repeat protein
MSETQTRAFGPIRAALLVVVFTLFMPLAALADAADKNQELIRAVSKGDLAEATRLLNSGADVNTKTEYGWTPLMWAASKGYQEISKMLLNKGADTNAQDNEGRTALVEAALCRRLSVVKLLLDNGADVNAKSKHGRTALMMLDAETDRSDVVKLLLDKGADINANNENGQTALMLRASEGSLMMVQLLLDRGAGVNAKDKNGWTALMSGVTNGHLEVVELLLGRGADVNARALDGRTVLMEAAARDYHVMERGWHDRISETFWEPIKRRIDGIWISRVPTQAKEWNDPQIVALLVKKGADVNARDKNGWTALKRAQIRGSSEIVNILKAHGAKE